MDLTKLCRLCGKSTGDISYNIFDKNDKDQQLIQLIKQCVPILVYRTDPLSKRMCEECYYNLNNYCQFLNQCIAAQEYFINEWIPEPEKDDVKLYFNALENHQSDFLSMLACKKAEMKHFSCQVSNTDIDEAAYRGRKRASTRSFKILTPEVINEINKDQRSAVTSLYSDGQPVKRRKLAGPKSKTRRLCPPISPPSLLQCALQKINEKITDASYDRKQHNSRRTFNRALNLYDSSENFEDYSFDPYLPVGCNYCMESFPTSIELAKHEVKHILVDVGPKVENIAFASKYRTHYKLYLNWRRRVVGEKIALSNIIDTDLYNEHEHDQVEPSLLVPEASHADNVFEVINEVININGIPLKDYDKTERRLLYKSITVDGVKRKFCPICRHTFKDNWAIDIHYENSSCQYTCKYCGMKFKHHKDLFPEHLKLHEGEPCNKIFGPTDRRSKFKKRRVLKLNRFGALTGTTSIIPPKIKPIKMKQLLQRKAVNNRMVKIKTEPGTTPFEDNSSEAVNLEKAANIQPYQAYFCRKCFKVFFKIDEFNIHTSVCKGTGSTERETVTVTPSILTEPEQSKSSESDQYTESEGAGGVKRPIRSCVQNISLLAEDEDETDSIPGTWSPKITLEKDTPPKAANTGGFECGICCSSFPSRHSRNSHMRIHKAQKISSEKISNFISTKVVTPPKPDHIGPKTGESKGNNIRLANLNPTVARLVQNNPHLTIRSYTKTAASPEVAEGSRLIEVQPDIPYVHVQDQVKRAYRCSDCNGRFENKSLLYYHKMQNCIVKRHYECAFCKKKFGGQEQYNSHMLYVHPE